MTEVPARDCGEPTAVLVTGANGFVGKALALQLSRMSGFRVSVAVRKNPGGLPASIGVFANLDLSRDCDWTQALANVDCVVHCAARVHVMNEKSADPLEQFRRINTQGTLNLAARAVAAGVRRFVFLSSLKVNGESSEVGKPIAADDAPNPSDPYGISKLEAEAGLAELAKRTGLEVVIIRPPLVYGPNVKANFRAMLKWLDRSIPLPLGAIKNQRSLVALDNLVDFIITCTVHPAAKNQVFLISDGQDLSTTQLLQMLAEALNKRALLIPVPASLLNLAAVAVGKKSLAQRLLGSLHVDIKKNHELLDWAPVVSVRNAFKNTADSFHDSD
jgi:nucleoside-diphosphate-sugar epimerase